MKLKASTALKRQSKAIEAVFLSIPSSVLR